MKLKLGTLEVGLIFLILAIVIGCYYFFIGNGARNINYKQAALIREKSVLVTPQEYKEPTPTILYQLKRGGECPSLSTDPNLKNKYAKMQMKECGNLESIDYEDEKGLSNIRDCLNSAIKSCTTAKAYIYMQGIEGSIEYILSVNECELNVEMWRTTTPDCGLSQFSCKEVSRDFPSEMCDGK